MSVTFTKLFASITESTVWCEPDSTRIVWITMLAMADSKGRVWASIPGLANRARVTVQQVENALITFKSPDHYSRTPDNEGRRVEDIDGGWRLLNHEKYRGIRDEESIKESKRRYINERRKAEKAVEQKFLQSNSVELCRYNAEAEADTDKTKPKVKSIPPSAFDAINELALLGVSLDLANEWIAVRKSKRGVALTKRVIDGLVREASISGISVSQAVMKCCERGWITYDSSFVATKVNPQHINGKSQHQLNKEITARALFGSLLDSEQSALQTTGETYDHH